MKGTSDTRPDPEGKEMAIFGGELAAESNAGTKLPVQMTHLRGGIFDEASSP